MKFIIILIITTYSLLSQETIWEIEDADSIKSEIKLSKYKEYFYYKNANDEFVVRKVDDGSVYNKFTIDGELITINEKFDSYYYHNSGTFSKVSFGGDTVSSLIENQGDIFDHPYSDELIIFDSYRNMLQMNQNDLTFIKNEYRFFNRILYKKSKYMLFDSNNTNLFYLPQEFQDQHYTGRYGNHYFYGGIQVVEGNESKILNDTGTNKYESLGYPKKSYKIGDSILTLSVRKEEYQRDGVPNYHFDAMFSYITLNNQIQLLEVFKEDYQQVLANQDITKFSIRSNDSLITYNRYTKEIEHILSKVDTLIHIRNNTFFTLFENTLKLINANSGQLTKTFNSGKLNNIANFNGNHFILNDNSKIKHITINNSSIDNLLSIDAKKQAIVGETISLKAHVEGELEDFVWNLNGEKILGKDIEYEITNNGLIEVVLIANNKGDTLTSTKIIEARITPEPKINHYESDSSYIIYSDLYPEDYKFQWIRYGEIISTSDTLVIPKNDNVVKVEYQFSKNDIVFSGQYSFVDFNKEIDLEPNNINIDSEIIRMTSNNNGFICFLDSNKNLSLWKDSFYFHNKTINIKDPDKFTINNDNITYFINNDSYVSAITVDGSINNLDNRIIENGRLTSQDSFFVIKNYIFDSNANLVLKSIMERIYGGSTIHGDMFEIDNLKDNSMYLKEYVYVDYGHNGPPDFIFSFRIDLEYGMVYNNGEFLKFADHHGYNLARNVNYGARFFGESNGILIFGKHAPSFEQRSFSFPPHSMPRDYGFNISVNGKDYSFLEIENIIDYIKPEYYFEYDNNIYSKNVNSDLITKINLKGDYVSHSVDLYHTWVLTRDGDDYYLTDLNPDEPDTSLVEDFIGEDYPKEDEIIFGDKIDLKGKKGQYSINLITGQQIEKGSFEDYIQLEHLLEGLYLVKIQTDDGKTFTKKIIRY